MKYSRDLKNTAACSYCTFTQIDTRSFKYLLQITEPSYNIAIELSGLADKEN